MKVKPFILKGDTYVPCDPKDATHIRMESPGPISTILLPVQIKGTREGTGNWTWNGDVEKPTLRPSVLNRFENYDGIIGNTFINHIWITDGKVIFLGDCSHELVGKTVDLLDVT
jgi:hypothetical protein